MPQPPSERPTRASPLARRRRQAVLLLAATGVAAVAVAVLAAAGSGPASHAPLVASTQRQPAGEPATAAPTRTADGADDPEGDTVTPAPRPAPAPPRHDGAPGHGQGGAAPPPPSAGPSVSVPILLYHYIRVNPRPSDEEGFRLSVTPANFAQQMALLSAEGGHTVSLDDVMAALGGGPPLPPHAVVLTFDDGHDDLAVRAVPVLQSYGFTATAFVVPGFLGRPSYLTTAQLQQVVDAGITIGAHTMHHVDLAAVAPSVAADEISRSRSVLQRLTGQPVADFAYPYGIFTSRVVAMVRQAGFRDASTTEPGGRQYASQPFLLRRTEVSGYDTLSSFARKAGLPPPPRGWVAPSPAASASPLASPSPSATATADARRRDRQ
jgi:peptidoglycan/xylan/chitin deacetylase (PgdA/CDA1 family)